MMQNSRLSFLFYRVIDGTASPAEKQELAELVVQPAHEAELQALMDEGWETFPEKHKLFSALESERMLQKALGREEQQPVVPLHRSVGLRRWWVAATVITLLGLATFLWFRNEKTTAPPLVDAKPVQDAKPGGNKAILTLADGSKLILDSMANGKLAEQELTVIEKHADGQLAYTASSTATPTPVYNTLSTPRGGHYQLTLPDGTRVWLNAASSITYPVAFHGKQRTVSITGEAYFEVRKDAAHPFVVNSGKMDVTVLGTHFNINAYEDEDAMRTTLLEGSVRVSSEWSAVSEKPQTTNHKQQTILKPGEQAVLTTNHKLQTTNNINLDQIMAWKNGSFHFNGVELPVILRQLSRWYDVNIVYQGEAKPVKIGGEMGMDLNLSQVLTVLEKTGLHVKLEGKNLIILP